MGLFGRLSSNRKRLGPITIIDHEPNKKATEWVSSLGKGKTEKYCKDYSPQGIYPHINNGLAIEVWINYVDQIILTFHFKWVGERYNPFVVAKPFKYDSNKTYKWTQKNV